MSSMTREKARNKRAQGKGKVSETQPEQVEEQQVEEKVTPVEQKKAPKPKSRFGHWADSVRGRLDELLEEGGTITEIAEKAEVSVQRVRQHLRDLRAQERGKWGPKVTVHNADGVYQVTLNEE